jgi:2-polyprenyl-3-methyl-5-hydroxy-6-metoxy-1,4-benzoquinol methylase
MGVHEHGDHVGRVSCLRPPPSLAVRARDCSGHATPVTGTFRSQLYEKYVSEHQGVLDGARRYPTLKRDIVDRLYPASHASCILDVGCGQGDLIALLREHGWSNVRGIDISEEQVATAARLGVADVDCADVYEHAATHPHSYDVVLAVDVVEHFDRSDALQLFHALLSMLVPGGRLIMQTPNGASPFSGRIFWSDVTHGVQYTDRSLRQICGAAGFRSVDAFPTRPAVHGMTSLLRSLIWRAFESVLWLAAAAETGNTRGLIFTQNLIAVATSPE